MSERVLESVWGWSTEKHYAASFVLFRFLLTYASACMSGISGCLKRRYFEMDIFLRMSPSTQTFMKPFTDLSTLYATGKALIYLTSLHLGIETPTVEFAWLPFLYAMLRNSCYWTHCHWDTAISSHFVSDGLRRRGKSGRTEPNESLSFTSLREWTLHRSKLRDTAAFKFQTA